MNDLLTYIDQIQEATDNAEINVLESLIETYDKSIVILEECEDIEPYADILVFQEGAGWDKFKEDTKAPILGNKGENIFKRLLMIIPRLIQKLIAMVRKIFKKNKTDDDRIKKEMKDLKSNEKTKFKQYKMSDEDVDKIMTKLRKKRNQKQNATNTDVDKTVADTVSDKKTLGELMFTIHDDFVFKKTDFGDAIENLKYTDFDGLRISEEIKIKAAEELNLNMFDDFIKNCTKCRDDLFDRVSKIKNRIPNDISVTYSTEETGGSNYITLSYSEIIEKLEKLNNIILNSRREMRDGFDKSYNKSIVLLNDKYKQISLSLDDEIKRGEQQGLSQGAILQQHFENHPAEPQLCRQIAKVLNKDSENPVQKVIILFEEFIASYIILWDKYYWAVKNAIDNAKKEMNCNGKKIEKDRRPEFRLGIDGSRHG